MQDDAMELAGFLEDAAHYPGGHAAGIVFPRSTADLAGIVSDAGTVLAIGAQSSLTGGATPLGETIIATSRMARILEIGPDRVTVEAGVTVAAMQEALADRGAWFPPAPTFTGACAGGIVATNAAGAATFKYGSTRAWVLGLTVVLADGSIARVERGRARAKGGYVEIATDRGARRVPVPTYTMPAVPKHSAGYYAAAEMDVIDLFIGSEGTLGVITEITFRVLRPTPLQALALVPCTSEAQAFDLVAALRRASRETWRTCDPYGVDAAAIEHMDRRSLEIAHEDSADERNNLAFAAGTELALLIQLELPDHTTAAGAYEQIADALSDGAPDGALARFCRMLDAAGLLDATELALPADARRAAELTAFREAIPAGVNGRVGAAQRDVDRRIEKTAADMIVPYERFGRMMDIYRRGFDRRGLDYAVWGHISDGNVHPNVIPRSYDDVVAGREAILEFGREVARLGGCPLAEHGVGRNAVKQALLRQLYGDAGIEQMRTVKRVLDPAWKLAPGVIFPSPPAAHTGTPRGDL